MNRADTARLLAVIAAFDRRTVGDMDVIAWNDALADMHFKDCAEAVRDHYRHRTDWCMPAHVRGYIERKRRDEAEARHASRLHTELPNHDHDRQHVGYLEAVAELSRAFEQRKIISGGT